MLEALPDLEISIINPVYSTAGEPVDFVSDAGAGKTHDGFKFSTFALPVVTHPQI